MVTSTVIAAQPQRLTTGSQQQPMMMPWITVSQKSLQSIVFSIPKARLSISPQPQDGCYLQPQDGCYFWCETFSWHAVYIVQTQLGRLIFTVYKINPTVFLLLYEELLPCICLLYWFPGQCNCTFVRRRNVEEILWMQNRTVYSTVKFISIALQNFSYLLTRLQNNHYFPIILNPWVPWQREKAVEHCLMWLPLLGNSSRIYLSRIVSYTDQIQNHTLGWAGRTFKCHLLQWLQWAGTSSTTSGCSDIHLIQPWMFQGMGHLQRKPGTPLLPCAHQAPYNEVHWLLLEDIWYPYDGTR